MTSIWVYTSENHGTSIEVPLTPETTVLDVLDCVRDPVRGEGYLVAVAGDTEYILQEGDNAFTFLYEIWNTSGSPLTFLLRYYNQQAEWPPPELEARRHQMRKPQKEVSSGDMGKLPGEAGDLTLAELQEMASRQQQQMEAQQQVLVAKEQRLKYLKQQEARHAQLASESERLRKIRERVESQELKLKKLRALRGQAEQYRANNGNLNTELDAVKAVFNEKEKELAMAVARVDQLTRQLQDLRNGVNNGLSGNKQAAAAAELEKLRKELLIRNKLNEQQSNTISAKEKVLNQRREEVARMDARIYELQQRLRKRRSQEQQIVDQNQGNKINNAKSGNQQPVNSNVATVEPYIQYAPHDVVKDDSFSKPGGFMKQDPKYQTLPSNVKFISPNKPGEEPRIGKQQEMNNNTELIEEYKLPIVLPMDKKLQKNLPNHHPSNQQQQHFHTEKDNTEKVGQPTKQQVPSSVQNNSVNQNIIKLTKSDPATGTKSLPPESKLFPPTSARSNTGSAPQLRPHVSLIGAGDGSGRGPGMLPPSATSSAHPIININEEERQAGSGQSSPASSEASSNSSGGIQIKRDNEINTSPIGPVSAMIEKLNKGTTQPQPATQPPAASQNRSNFTQRVRPPSQEGNNTNVTLAKIRQGGSLPHTHVSETSPQQDEVDSSRMPPSTSSSNGSIQASQPTSSAPHLNQKPAPTYRYASKNQIANTYMGRLGGAAMEKYQRNLNMLYKNMDSQGLKPGSARVAEGKTSFADTQEIGPPSAGQGHPQFGAVSSPNYPDIASDKGSYKLNTPKHVRRRHSDSENEDLNKALQERQDMDLKQQQPSVTPAMETKIQTKTDSSSQPADKSSSQPSQEKDKSGKVAQQPASDKPAESNSATVSATHQEEKKSVPQSATSKSKQKVEAVLKRTKSNLKKEGSKKNGNRVSFDPLALLLDASLEGELDLVKKVAVQVDDVSTPNDEGITALHNAICAGHYEIVKFLVEFGCDVNSPDSDGWTPLHCAASCNNLPMVRFLVEHGACVFATTISDHETAADKCEEEEDGYDGCSDYLYSIQEKLGITNNGEVYGVFDYQATQTDELSFVIGDKMTVLRKGDEKEKEWWWARLNGKEGYIPRNLLGLYPRVIQRPKEVSEC